MARILVLLVGIAIVVLMVLMMFRGPGTGSGSGDGAAVTEGSAEAAGTHAEVVVPIELLVEGSGLFVDDAPVGSVDAMLEAARTASTAGRPITLVIPGSAAAATVTQVRDALERAGLNYAVSTSH